MLIKYYVSCWLVGFGGDVCFFLGLWFWFFFGKVTDQTVMQKKPVFPLKYH